MTLPLERFTIHAFRGLRELTLDKLARVNILVGDNNSGKTSVLEAIYVYGHPFDTQALMYISRVREGLGRRLSLERVRWLFPKDSLAPSTEGRVWFDGVQRGAHQRCEISMRDVIGVPSQKTEQLSLFSTPFENESIGSAENKPREQAGIELMMTAGYVKGSTKVRQDTIWENARVYPKPMAQELSVVFAESYGHKTFGVYVELFKVAYELELVGDLVALLQQYDADVLDLSVQSEDGFPSLYIKHAVTGLTPIMAFGDGMRCVLYMAMRIIMAKGGICLLDEFDNAMHPSVLAASAGWLVGAANKLDVQLFLTTHNLEALDAILAKCDVDDLAAYHLGGNSAVKRISGEMLHRLRFDRGLDVR